MSAINAATSAPGTWFLLHERKRIICIVVRQMSLAGSKKKNVQAVPRTLVLIFERSKYFDEYYLYFTWGREVDIDDR